MALSEIRQCTRREIAELIDAMVARKKGWPEEEGAVKMESTDEIKARIAKARARRFQGVTDGGESANNSNLG